MWALVFLIKFELHAPKALKALHFHLKLSLSFTNAVFTMENGKIRFLLNMYSNLSMKTH